MPAIFALMNGVLEQLCRHGHQAQIVQTFELKLLAELGLQPDLDKEKLKPDLKQIIQVLPRE